MILKKSRTAQEMVAILCKNAPTDLQECYKCNHIIPNSPCYLREQCRIIEKSDQQIQYVDSSIKEHIFLEACPGSGKTEVVGFKTAYEMQRWEHKFSGIAVLTFTNTATKEIEQRVRDFTRRSDNYPHFIGTFNSWLHSYIIQPFGYRIGGFQGRQNDLTMRLIDRHSRHSFINNFKVWIKMRKLVQIPVNQYTWEPLEGLFSYYQRNERIILKPSLKELENLKATKKRFWKAGFFTHDDVDAISYLLSKEDVGRRLAARFPYIVVDECQDLSPGKLGILRGLAKCGTKIHLVGDLSQSIFGFTGADPGKMLNFVDDLDFTRKQLSQNYRSLQTIVDISCKLVDRANTILSCSLNKRESSVVLFEYPDKDFLPEIPKEFMAYLEQKKIPINDSVIMARGTSTLKRLGATIASSENNLTITLATAYKQWLNKKELFECEHILIQFGRFIHNVFFDDIPLAGYRTYSCPEAYSPIQWRLLLFRLLKMMEADQALNNLEQSWSIWLRSVKAFFQDNICSGKGWPNQRLKTLKSPKNKADDSVNSSLGIHSVSTGVRVTTIHDIKGETVGAGLLVSSADRRGGRGGHWTDWLSGDDPEHARFAYVASSRPVHTLAWAVPKLSKEQREQMLDFGFDEIIQWGN